MTFRINKELPRHVRVLHRLAFFENGPLRDLHRRQFYAVVYGASLRRIRQMALEWRHNQVGE